ncbi:MAG: four helix bundle protein [Holophagaceae bacterium]|nr:four helix bundle protein [Holophagaceae bacterium]
MRDHRELKAFILADELVLDVHKCVLEFPSRETFVLGAQLRKASLSTASNIVEGCARKGHAEFLHFLSIAMGSAREVEYQLSVARRLGYPVAPTLEESASEVCKVLRGLIQSHHSG